MQRQSLGSPSSKLAKEDTLIAAADDDAPKTHRLSTPPSSPHKFIHLIPILTLLCFFILYLCSHTPTPSDLDHFTGFNSLPKHHLAAEIGDIGHHYMDAKRGGVLAIRNLRSLQQLPHSRLHRKLADF